MAASTPFGFSTVNERSILRFLKLIACDNGKIGTYAKLVDDRNQTAHPNGHIYYTDAKAFDVKIASILRAVDEIQTHSKCIIEECYLAFLMSSHDPEEREYLEDADQIREVLIHGHYLSQKDIEFCLAFDPTVLLDGVNDENIRRLHESLLAEYQEPSEVAG